MLKNALDASLYCTRNKTEKLKYVETACGESDG
jgi:hypothetical protein